MKNDASVTYASVDALAKDLGVSRQTVYAGLRNGTIPAIRLGRRYVLPKTAIMRWLESAGRNPDSPRPAQP